MKIIQILNLIYNVIFIGIITLSAYTDIKKRIIPNKLVICMIILSLTNLITKLIYSYNTINILHFLLSTFLGLLIAIIFTGIPYYTNKSIGAGDVKLAGASGLFLGFRPCLQMLFISFLSCAVISIIIVIYNNIQKKPQAKTMPFAPFLLVGAFYSLIIKLL